jgi:hypothetical protein
VHVHGGGGGDDAHVECDARVHELREPVHLMLAVYPLCEASPFQRARTRTNARTHAPGKPSTGDGVPHHTRDDDTTRLHLGRPHVRETCDHPMAAGTRHVTAHGRAPPVRHACACACTCCTHVHSTNFSVENVVALFTDNPAGYIPAAGAGAAAALALGCSFLSHCTETGTSPD